VATSVEQPWLLVLANDIDRALHRRAASGRFGAMAFMHWLYYVFVAAAVVVALNVVILLYFLVASRD
jgi:hypothetical protein